MSIKKDSALQLLLDTLKSNKNDKIDYQIPKTWDTFGFSGKKQQINDKVIAVNPNEFFIECIEKQIIPKAKGTTNYSKSISLNTKSNSGGDWIKKSNIYSMLPRITTACSHSGEKGIKSVNKDGYRETGTFLKTLALLPMFKKMEIDTVYLLPVTKYSNICKKGEIGSIYAGKSFFSLDPELHDPLFGGDKIDAGSDFKAFVEACHIMGMRVVLDFIPRSCARDNELILEHPEWFYWIKKEEEASFKPPAIPTCGFQIPDVDCLERIYSTPEVNEHLKKFSFSPDVIDKAKWDKLVKKIKDEKIEDFMDEIVKEFGIITPPGFSDWLNDTQPTWDDITFLRLHMTHPADSVKYLKDADKQPPYILHDVIKASKFPGAVKNQGLWDTITGIMPFFQQHYGVDGVRVDMGHALPKELEENIIKKARKADPDFCFIAEEFVTDNHKKARESGYNIIIGDSWWKEPRIKEGEFKKFLYKILPELALNIMGCGETADSPRATSRKGDKKFAKFSIGMNAFIPNSSPMITSGIEIFEVQPTNLGLDNSPEGRFLLPKDDPFYGKLGFFDNYALHWTSVDDNYGIDYICKIHKLRNGYVDYITNISNYREMNTWESINEFLGCSYILKDKKQALLVFGNGDLDNNRDYHVNMSNLTNELNIKNKKIQVLFSDKADLKELPNMIEDGNNLFVSLLPNEVMICLVQE